MTLSGCYRNFILLAFILLSPGIILAQRTSTLVQGKVIDDGGKPVSAELFFTPESGRTIRCKSNSSDGSYQQIIEPGKNYLIIVKKYIPVERRIALSTPSSYQEITKDIQVKTIETGMELDRLSAFKSNDTLVDTEMAKAFDYMKKLLDNNLHMDVVITVSSEDSFFKSKRVKQYYTDKRGRRRYKRVRLSAEDQANALIDARIASITEYFAGQKKYRKRVSFERKLVVKNPPKRKKRRRGKKNTPVVENAPVYNIYVSVGKLKNF